MAPPPHTRAETSEMRTAVLISGGAHLAIVLAAFVAGQLFSSDDSAEFQVAEVSLVPASSFDADISDKLAAAPETAPEQPKAPEAASTPDPVAPPEAPAPAPNPRPAPVASPPAPTTAESPEDVATLATPPAPETPAPTESAPPPRPEAKPETPEPPSQPEVAEAPKPEPEKPAEEERAAVAPPPRPRPTRVARAAEAEPEPKPQPDPKPEKPTETAQPAKPTEAAQPARPTAQASAPERSGPPLTYSEKDGIRFAIQRCWSVPVGLEAAENLSVTLGVTLSREGQITAGPDLIEPKGTLSPGHKVAYQAARRALMRCAPYTGFPPEKYAQWRELEVTFNPKEMVIQ